jgi:aryl-alcohol dehydrogenase-like predicted oxidoreductase
MQALNDVVKAGYVRYIGMSSCWAYQFLAMQSEWDVDVGVDIFHTNAGH